jgi:hypothetical protein
MREEDDMKVAAGYAIGHKVAQGQPFELGALQCRSRGGETMGLCRMQ